VVGLLATRRQLEEILNAPPDFAYAVEVLVKPGDWLVRPEPGKPPRKGWPTGLRRTLEDRQNPGRTGRPRKAAAGEKAGGCSSV
jgi:hypothetical protein